MKFGVQLYDRATAKWRGYNLDYQELKTAIRLATSGSQQGSNGDNSSEDTSRQTHSQRQALRALYRAFEEQIELVSLFVDAKTGELGRRLAALKKQCNLLIKQQSHSHAANSTSTTNIMARVAQRKIVTFKKELDDISRDLQDLSRFILLQKIALRKLFKKFVKHSDYEHKQKLVDKMTRVFLVENPKSFTNANLKDLSNEMALLFDFLTTFNEEQHSQHLITRDRQMSIHTLDSLTFPSRPQLAPSNPLESRIATFDIISKKKGPRSHTFWVHEDNINEIKFLLSSEFKLITDESVLVEERRSHSQLLRKEPSSGAIKLRETRSTLNLNEMLKQDKSISPPAVVLDGNSNNNNDDQEDDQEFIPETDTRFIWLNNPNDPFMTNSSNTQPAIETPTGSMKTFQAEPYSQICLSTPEMSSAVLFTPVGGLRQFTVATLNQNLMDTMFALDEKADKSELKARIKEEYIKNQLIGNPMMAEISLNWVIDNNVKPLAYINTKRLRYITTNSKGDKITSYISLDYNIHYGQENASQLANQVSSADKRFKHAVLQLHFDSNVKDLPNSIQNLINSHLVYQVDQLNFSMNNFLVWQYLNEKLTDESIINFVAPWFDIYDDKDIRKIPSIEEPQKGILLNKNDVPSGINGTEDYSSPTTTADAATTAKFKYWNEFDDGSDYGNDNNGFYINDDLVDEEDDDVGSNGPGLNWLSNANIKKILDCSDQITGLFEKIKNGGLKKEHIKLIRPVQRHYSIFDDNDSDEYDDDDEYYSGGHGVGDSYGAINSGETIKYANHDDVLSFIYMTCCILSYMLAIIGMGLVIGILQNSILGLTRLGTLLVIIAMMALLLAVLLSVAAVCLSMCRYLHAPIWHYVSIWVGVIFASVGLVFGLTMFI